MISKTEDLIKKVMLKARQLTETSEEKNEKYIQNEYAGNKNHFTFLCSTTNFFLNRPRSQFSWPIY